MWSTGGRKGERCCSVSGGSGDVALLNASIAASHPPDDEHRFALVQRERLGHVEAIVHAVVRENTGLRTTAFSGQFGTLFVDVARTWGSLSRLVYRTMPASRAAGRVYLLITDHCRDAANVTNFPAIGGIDGYAVGCGGLQTIFGLNGFRHHAHERVNGVYPVLAGSHFGR